ncbi:MAG: TIGR03087 family PEP-CTERM/XrtA system glycosyltransferase [Chromatiales bacterium]|nr:TIGR03087 family PEP-CTERM/XrtA system glycosyltransferase [Chromatiales bacterium]
MSELLFLVHRIPYPPNKGDKIRSFHLLEHLRKRFTVHLGCFVDDPDDWPHVDVLRGMCDQSCFLPLNPTRSKLKSLSALFTGKPLTLPYYFDRRMAEWVEGILARPGLKTVVMFSSSMAQYIDGAQVQGRRTLLDFVDVDSDKWSQYAASKTWPLNWLYRREGRTLLQFEREMARRFDTSVFVSGHETELFARLAPESASRVIACSNGVDFAYFSPEHTFPSPFSHPGPVLVFTGAMDYWANVDAVVWFARKVFPGLRERYPGLAFVIVGSRPGPEVQGLTEIPGVTVTGTVPDVRPYLAHCDAAVIPLRIARGIQNKVLEAMAMGKPVVTTRAAFEGIDAKPEQDLLLADDEAQLIKQCERLLNGQVDTRRMGDSARNVIVEKYDWEKNLQRLDGWLTGSPRNSEKVSGT